MIDDKTMDELMLKYSYALQILESHLNILIKEYEFKNKYNLVEHIKSRMKSEKSAIDKLIRKEYKVNISNLKIYVHDMIGVRIVCPFISDVYEIIELIKKCKDFKVKEERDYIKNPKDSGYMSYHIIISIPIFLDKKQEYIPAEIQIRTMAMDFWATLDHKIQYKFPDEVPNDVKREMLECSKSIQQLDDKMFKISENVKKYNDL